MLPAAIKTPSKPPINKPTKVNKVTHPLISYEASNKDKQKQKTFKLVIELISVIISVIISGLIINKISNKFSNRTMLNK